ncbi:hypothetical protein C3369_06670 [Escherichia sp. ESNIH1]|nr:hypothetical protein C3369_06670 [Escherichia sp. ESNIH1]
MSRQDLHPLDGLFYYIGSRWVMIPLWISTVVVGAIISISLDDWSWLARFGALGVMVGTLLTLSPLFRGGIYLSNAKAFGFGSVDDENKTTATSPETRSTSINMVIGTGLIVISSVINAFGDIIARSIS